jgi:hypothetical protein
VVRSPRRVAQDVDARLGHRAMIAGLGALDIARQQNARAFELRSGTSLVRLWRDQGHRRQPRDVLASIPGSRMRIRTGLHENAAGL